VSENRYTVWKFSERTCWWYVADPSLDGVSQTQASEGAQRLEAEEQAQTKVVVQGVNPNSE
jgi:hypothetical protein